LLANTFLPLATPGAGTNRFTDIGLDSQYQYQGDGWWLTMRATYLHENQSLGASVANGLAANVNNTLNTFRAQAALTYGTDGKIILTGGYFNTWGSSDAVLYGGNRTFSPNSDGFIGSPTRFSARITHQNYGRGSTRGSGCNTSLTAGSTVRVRTSMAWERTPATTTRCWPISRLRFNEPTPKRERWPCIRCWRKFCWEYGEGRAVSPLLPSATTIQGGSSRAPSPFSPACPPRGGQVKAWMPAQKVFQIR
jgi:hypothetical protein